MKWIGPDYTLSNRKLVPLEHLAVNPQVGGFIALILGVSFMDLVRILELIKTKLVEKLMGKNEIISMFQ